MSPALSPMVSRGLALAILVALVLLAFTGIVQPLLETYGTARAAAEQMRTAIAHAERVGRNPAELKTELAQLKERQNSTVGFLRGFNEPLAAAELQDRLKTIVESARGELRSTQILPARDEGKVRRISIRCQIQADITELQRVFYQLEFVIALALPRQHRDSAASVADRRSRFRPRSALRPLWLYAERVVKEVRPRGRGRAAALLFFLLCGGLGWVIYFEAQQPMEPSAAPEPRQESVANRSQDPTFSMAPLNTYAEVVSRPLFSPSRRPPAAASAADRPTTFTLIGIIISAEDRHALLAHGTPPHVERVTEGQNLDGWMVKSIEDSRVVLTQGDNEIEVKAAEKPGPGQVPLRPQALQPPAAASSPLRAPFRGPTANPQAGALPGLRRE